MLFAATVPEVAPVVLLRVRLNRIVLSGIARKVLPARYFAFWVLRTVPLSVTWLTTSVPKESVTVLLLSPLMRTIEPLAGTNTELELRVAIPLISAPVAEMSLPETLLATTVQEEAPRSEIVHPRVSLL